MGIAGVIVAFAAAVIVGAGAPAAAVSVVTGTASYPERLLLPADAVFEATLQDISRAEAPAITIGRTAITNPVGATAPR